MLVRWSFLARRPRPRSLACALLLGLGLPGAAAPTGLLDPSFGFGSGKVVLPLPPFVAASIRAEKVRIRPDGRILVLASVTPAGGPLPQGLVLYQLLPDGSLDPEFGVDGLVALEPSPNAENWPRALALAPDGRIVLGGTSKSPIGTHYWFVGRRLADGSIDASFNGGLGWEFVDFLLPQAEDWLVDLAVYQDGSILGLGTARASPTLEYFALARLLASGEADGTFGVDGKGLASFAEPLDSSTDVYAESLRLDPVDGSIVFVGRVRSVVSGSHVYRWAMSRLTTGGYFDLTFNGTGKLTGSFDLFDGQAFDDRLVSVARSDDGAYLAVGDYLSSSGPDRGVLVRILDSGTVDADWGFLGNSWFVFSGASGYNRVRACVSDLGARPLCSGESADGSQVWGAAARFVGPLFDTTFGSGGTTLFAWGTPDDSVADAALDPNGRLVVVGSTFVGSSYRASVARLRPGLPFAEDFESGNLDAWGATVP